MYTCIFFSIKWTKGAKGQMLNTSTNTRILKRKSCNSNSSKKTQSFLDTLYYIHKFKTDNKNYKYYTYA